MTIEPIGLAAILNAVMWPLIAVIAVILLRKPLTSLVGTLGQRIQRISVGALSLDIASLSEVKSTSLDSEIRQLEPSQPVQSGVSSLESLFAETRRGGKQDYVVIDL
jgi:hypothetical protein